MTVSALTTATSSSTTKVPTTTSIPITTTPTTTSIPITTTTSVPVPTTANGKNLLDSVNVSCLTVSILFYFNEQSSSMN